MWNVAIWQGEWKGSTAGGCKNHKSFKENPQFTFRLDGEDASYATGVVFQSEQGEDFSKLGFYVFKTERDERMKSVREADIVTKAVFDDPEEVSHELEEPLQPGKYVQVFRPSAWDFSPHYRLILSLRAYSNILPL